MMTSSALAIDPFIGRTDRTASCTSRPILDTKDRDINVGYLIHNTKLGEGGFGTVKLATHYATQQKVAIKIMNKQKLAHDLFRVKTEVAALKVLNHQNIAKLLQVIETDDDIYLVLEYCSGGELFDYLISKTRLTESETKVIMRDLVSVLEYIHSSGFAHRDLKPENILFDKNRKIKLIDFGLSAHCRSTNDSRLHLKTCCGSPAYAAPELLKGLGYFGPEVDIWSAGVLLYTLLAGQLPFDDKNMPNLFRKIQLGNYKVPPFLSKEAMDLIGCMLRTDPKSRANITTIKNHPWLRPDNDKSMKLNQIQVMPSFQEVVEICQALKFNGIDRQELERQILCDYGYKTATFWLIRNNRQLYLSLLRDASAIIPKIRSQNRRRSRSESNIDGQESTENVSKCLSAKRPTVVKTLNGCQSTKQVSPKTGPNISNGCPLSVKLNDNKTPTRVTLPKRVMYIQSPKTNDSTRLLRTRLSPALGDGQTPAKSARLLPPIKESHNSSGNRTPVVSKTPNTTKTNESLALTATTTPTTSVKKSLLKRLLESATPTKRSSPRELRQSADETNITRTAFTEPQELIQEVIDILAKRSVQCTRKANFSLKCVLSSMNIIVLSFNLEICKTDGKCVLIRKRLKGSSWDYMKICEDIDRLSLKC